MERPILNKELDSKTFRNYYFLKEELVNFCRENGMPTSGSKIEIADRSVGNTKSNYKDITAMKKQIL